MNQSLPSSSLAITVAVVIASGITYELYNLSNRLSNYVDFIKNGKFTYNGRTYELTEGSICVQNKCTTSVNTNTKNIYASGRYDKYYIFHNLEFRKNSKSISDPDPNSNPMTYDQYSGIDKYKSHIFIQTAINTDILFGPIIHTYILGSFYSLDKQSTKQNVHVLMIGDISYIKSTVRSLLNMTFLSFIK